MSYIFRNLGTIIIVIVSLLGHCPAWGNPGRHFNLDFKQVGVKTLLHKISQFADTNLVINPNINGQMSLHLEHVTWRQALDVIQESQNLDTTTVDNITYVSPHSQASGKDHCSFKTHVIHLNYAKAHHMAKLLNNQLDSSSKLSKITADKRTNSLVIEACSLKLKQINQLVNQLDIASPQVMVNARIVSIDQNYRRQLGVRFGLDGVKPFKNVASTSNTSAEGLHVALPSSAQATSNAGLAMFKVAKGVLVDTELSALATEGHAKIISNPKLVASNHKSAEIEAGRKIPFQEKTGEGATTATFKKAVLKLKVTPQIIHGDQLLLHLTVSQDSQGSERVLGVPTINTRQISTNVLVNNQRTIVLGGIYEQTQRNNTEKVPLLSAMPFVGQLFQFNDKRQRKRQLMIFVTPKLLKS